MIISMLEVQFLLNMQEQKQKKMPSELTVHLIWNK